MNFSQDIPKLTDKALKFHAEIVDAAVRFYARKADDEEISPNIRRLFARRRDEWREQQKKVQTELQKRDPFHVKLLF